MSFLVTKGKNMLISLFTKVELKTLIKRNDCFKIHTILKKKIMICHTVNKNLVRVVSLFNFCTMHNKFTFIG